MSDNYLLPASGVGGTGSELTTESPDTPQFDVGSFLTGVTTDISNIEQGLVTASEGHANKDLYQKYLDYFPQYAATKEQEYQTKEAQTLGDRLAAMGMRGIQTGGSDQPTSGAAAYTSQKSLYDAGYQTLVNQLDLEKTSAQGKLDVANAQVTAGDVTTGAAIGGAVGSIFGPVGTAIGAGIGAVAGWIASWF